MACVWQPSRELSGMLGITASEATAAAVDSAAASAAVLAS